MDERKAAIEVERRRAQEGAARLEAQLLELQSKLEAALQRERQAQADAEHTRSVPVACMRYQARWRGAGHVWRHRAECRCTRALL